MSSSKAVLDSTSANAAQVDAAVLVNADARLQALKVSLLALARIALLGIIPAGHMPRALLVEDDTPAEAAAETV